MRSKIILFALLCFSVIATAQINQPIRVEYDDDEVEDFDVFGFESKRIALVRYQNKKVHSRKEKVYVFDSYDEALKKTKTQSIAVAGKWDNTEIFNSSDYQFMLSYNRAKGTFLLVKIDPQTLDFTALNGMFGKKFTVHEWYVQGDFMYVAGSVKKQAHAIVININSGQKTDLVLKTLTPHALAFSDLERIKTPTGYEMGFQYSVEIKRKAHETYLLRFNEKGEKMGDFLVLPKPDAETELLNVSLTKVSNGSYIITGTYSKGKKGLANGIYCASLSESGLRFIKYENFLDLKNFTNYMSERNQAWVEKKQDKKEAKGEELNLNYRVVTHDIMELDGKYVYLGEFYYPTYRTEYYTVTSTTPSGQVITRQQSRQVFDGFQYSHAAIAAFAEDGALEWSNAFDMYVTNKPYRPRKFIRAGVDNSQIKLMYVTGSNIKAVSFDNKGAEAMSRSVEMISTNVSGDRIRYTYEGACEYWFGNSFLSSGFQKIKNKEEESGHKKRSVYFVNKISF
ncbi:MAG: hypothetical protein ACKOXB_06405 [Flavobacteriales bacterium]